MDVAVSDDLKAVVLLVLEGALGFHGRKILGRSQYILMFLGVCTNVTPHLKQTHEHFMTGPYWMSYI